MTATEWAWLLAGLSSVLFVLLVIAVAGNADLASENRRLREHLHPSTRNRKANR